ncbi:MAG: hypothetical protein CL938_05580 [Deltaproteobacteria bacterium]|nr:hypothetical protein [Deltaproteobacteria bacterium]
MTTTEKRRLSQRLCLVLLAVLLLDSTPAKAVYNPRITGYSPSSASAGTEVTIQGTGLGSRPYTVMYGTPGSISSTGEIPRDHILDWRGTAVRFRVPRAM